MSDKGSSALLGIYGGTFDPIHLGHINAAREVAEALEMSQVRLLVSATPPHRQQPVLSAEQRFKLVCLAAEGQSLLIADDSEIVRPGFSYMVDSLKGYREKRPDQPLALILGIDAFNGLKSWHNWQGIIKLAHIVVTDRADSDVGVLNELQEFVETHQVTAKVQLQQKTHGLLYFQTVTPLAISSTAIKQALSEQLQVDEMLPASVAQSIKTQGFYSL